MIAEPAGSDRYGGAMADVLHDASHPRATRVERSFAFVDLSGFTRFTDVREAHRGLREQFEEFMPHFKVGGCSLRRDDGPNDQLVRRTGGARLK